MCIVLRSNKKQSSIHAQLKPWSCSASAPAQWQRAMRSMLSLPTNHRENRPFHEKISHHGVSKRFQSRKSSFALRILNHNFSNRRQRFFIPILPSLNSSTDPNLRYSSENIQVTNDHLLEKKKETAAVELPRHVTVRTRMPHWRALGLVVTHLYSTSERFSALDRPHPWLF